MSGKVKIIAGIAAMLMPEALAGLKRSDSIEFQTFELDGEIKDMMWCGDKGENILVHTADGSIYRSRDKGANWKRLRTLMEKHGSTVVD